MKRYQVIWWGLRRWTYWWPPVAFSGYTHSLSRIYRWTLSIGPLEIRRLVKP